MQTHDLKTGELIDDHEEKALRMKLDSPGTLKKIYKQQQKATSDSTGSSEDASLRERSRFNFLPGTESIKTIKEFCFTPAPFEFKNKTIKARITREKSKIVSKTTQYYLHLENGNERSFIMSARKVTNSKSSYYIISTDTESILRSSGQKFTVGKLRSNVLGTKFIAYDNGFPPNSPKGMKDSKNIHEELVMICYDPNILGLHGPRKMTVIIPAMNESKQRIPQKPLSTDQAIDNKFLTGKTNNLVKLINVKPVWSEDSNSFVLNFHGRVTMASVKNFQIVHENDPHYLVMQFGRISHDVFTIDWRYPFCAFQAFAVALSSFDNKLACE